MGGTGFILDCRRRAALLFSGVSCLLFSNDDGRVPDWLRGMIIVNLTLQFVNTTSQDESIVKMGLKYLQFVTTVVCVCANFVRKGV